MMKKRKILPLLPFMCLCACSKSSIYGIYEFRLGKSQESHIGIAFELKQDAYVGKENGGFKQFTFVAELGNDFSPTEIGNVEPDSSDFFNDLISKAMKEGIKGYYRPAEGVSRSSLGQRLDIGTEAVGDLLKDVFPDLPSDLFLDITPEICEKIFSAYVDEKNLTLQIPVSMDDVQHQLAWYGMVIDLSSDELVKTLDETLLPGKAGAERIGTHPMTEYNENYVEIYNDVKTMNERFKFEFSNTHFYIGGEDAGKFVVEAGTSGAKHLFLKFSSEFQDKYEQTTPINGTVYVKDSFDYYSQALDVKVFNVAKDDFRVGSITDNSDNAVEFTRFMRPSYVFKDFHDVKIGLAKV